MAREVILVCTPAGFGKTTLLADWAAGTKWPVAWLSLDPEDNDPVRFWRYVVAALDRVAEGLGDHVLPFLTAPGVVSGQGVVTALVNHLQAAPEELALVLDDYHLMESAPIHEDLAFLLGHLPPRLHVVITSRSDPPLPLARLRARGQLAELRTADLRFTPEESVALLREVWGLDLTPEAAATLGSRTEGWAVGLQLAALSMRERPDADAFLGALAGTHRYVLDYLSQEVLERQPDRVRAFLLQTSILEQLCGPLCDAVTGDADGQEMLEGLERANLFLTPLDEVRGWWRYHHLFADLLRARLEQASPDRVAGLHKAAADWCQEHGLVDQAIQHALGAGDAEGAAWLMEQNFWTLLWRQEDATLGRWLAALPTEVARCRPWLCLALAQRAAMAGRLDEVERLLADAERAHAGRADATREPPVGATVRLADDVPSMIALLRASIARVYGDAEPATRFAKQSLAVLAGDDRMAHAMVDWALAQPDWLSGRLAQAEHTLARVVVGYRATGALVPALGNCYELARVQRAQGRLSAALGTCHEALEIASAIHPALPPAGAAHVLMAEVLRERNELDAAMDHATRGVALCRQLADAWPLTSGLATVAWIHQAQGDRAGAVEAMREAERVLPDPRVVELFNPAPAQAARLALAHGQVADVDRWVQQRGLGIHDEPSYPREREYLVLARVLLAEQAPRRTLGLLERLHALAVAQGRTASVIEIRTLQALALSASGDQAGALAALAEALTLGAPEGYLRVFVDEGPPMAALLRQLLVGRRQQRLAAAGAVPPGYLARLVDAFEQAGLPIRAPVRRGGVVVAGLVEPLTARELEVLQLLAAGAPNQEIAEQLVVTLDTVKKHTTHIFDKLGAANRTQAVVRARELRLIP
jgi:LuxR family transcriptional regulator, maltose regulon positive regulatory protein